MTIPLLKKTYCYYHIVQIHRSIVSRGSVNMSQERQTPQQKEGGGEYSSRPNNDFYSLTGKHRYVHTLGTTLKLLDILRFSALKSNKPISCQSAAAWPWTPVFRSVRGPISSQKPPFASMESAVTTVRNCKTIMSTPEFTHARMHTHSHTYTQSLWWRWWMLPTPCCVRSDVPGVGTARGASRSAVWASLPAPDNFTIPALAGGDNHIKLPWQEALNSASVPLRVWHPAASPEHAADVTMRRFVFSFFHSVASHFFFFFLFFFLFAAASKTYLGTIWVSMSLGRKSEMAESSVTAIALWEVWLY